MSMWTERPRDAFGRLLADPETLGRAERLDEVLRVAGRLQADPDRGSRWLGAALLTWLWRGGAFEDALALRPPQGSTQTAAWMLRQARQDAALLRLAAAAGCDRRALRILRGEQACPTELLPQLEAARESGSPTGPHAVTRARRRVQCRSMR